MKADLQKAKELLQTGSCTCVLCKGEETHSSTQRGVKPLLAWLEQTPDWQGYCAADRVVGRAAAFLYLLMGVKQLYAEVLSQHALRLLEQHHIECEYGRLVPAIRNRAGDGFCPMESAVRNIDDPDEAVSVIKQTLETLQEQKKREGDA